MQILKKDESEQILHRNEEDDVMSRGSGKTLRREIGESQRTRVAETSRNRYFGTGRTIMAVQTRNYPRDLSHSQRK